ncbi:Hypothetical Protein FCC1311_096232 [Hondaea fermentalgiana]|uniref:SANT and BTB domain-containing protein n=1 Tax=Hondaea fermentalgiana TaxID=2315210 RepID=A0A2R5GRC7_9STRA|nr:Hypothetical Protein FCC1311_096232 [Hondaea fermentalgiana]|eukprot:GBG33400.1 Hypothetical Protein FCC1311_096232 [Hondaea fermentalgiana]
MPYFRPYLKDLHKMDISVHCDVKIFEWLMRRIRSPDDARLDIRSATSVLIASEFLGMSTLVQEATAFVAQHLCEIMALPIDLTCLGDATVRRLARLISLNTLIGLSDPRNAILGTLYRLRAEELLQNHGPALTSCKHCSALYSRRFADRLICPRAPASVDFNGRLCQRHEPIADDWDVVRSFIVPMRHRKAQEWKRIFWTLWGATKLFQCTMCETYFDAGSTGG